MAVPRPARTLRIGVVAPPFYELPPRGYGGTELVCFLLAQGLVANGHDVAVAAAGRNRTSARFLATFEEPQVEGTESEGMIDVLHAIRATTALATINLDIIHDHTRAGLLTASARRAPTVATVHAPVAGPRSERDIFAALGRGIPLVAVSDSQRRSAPELNWIATVHNGIAVEEYPFVETKEDFVLFLGRTSDEKGVHVAIDAARATGRRLVIAGSWTIPAEQEYFDLKVRPHLGRGVEWVGEVEADAKKDLLGRAACVVFPALWEEPFGLVIVEALACGTPVAGLRAGAVPDLVDDRTGAVADDPARLADAIRAAVELDPTDCRARAESRFSTETMVSGYEAVYERVLGGTSHVLP